MKLTQQARNANGQGRKPAMHVSFDPDVRDALSELAAEAGATKARYLSFLIAREKGLPGHDLPNTKKTT